MPKKLEASSNVMYLMQILSQVPGNVYWKNIKGEYQGCNKNQLKVAKLSSMDEIIGKTDDDLYHKAIAAAVRAIDSGVMQSGKAQEFEEIGIDDQGNECIYLTQKSPLFDSNHAVIGVLGISMNITERKRAAEREKKAIQEIAEEHTRAEAETELRRAVTILAGSIAHDLRTPLSAMSITIDLARQAISSLADKVDAIIASDSLDDKTTYQLACINNLADKMKEKVSEMDEFISVTLRSMQRLLSGTLTDEDFIILDIEHCLIDVIKKYPLNAGEKELISFNIIDNFRFSGYPVLFYRIIFNLLKNALEQIHQKGKGNIFITAEEGEKFNLLRFKDTASGTSADIVANLFEGYKTTKEKGTGVGLAFCKLTMQSFGGDIICESKEGDYIEFTLSFPKLSNQH